MGQIFNQLSASHIEFINKQKIYFVGTAANEGTVNVSPKGLDSLKILSPDRIIWLNFTGSGNETSAHLLKNPRMTILFCAFDGNPLILRVYGTAKEHLPHDPIWDEISVNFSDLAGARQIFDLAIEKIQTSCGFGVPLYEYQNQRNNLPEWSEKKGHDGIKIYQQEKNQISLDGFPTKIFK